MWAGYPEFLDFLAEDFKERISVTEHRGQAIERRKSKREGVGDRGSLVWSYI